MIEALKGIFTSKKVLTAIIAALVGVGARYGLELDPEVVGIIVSAFVVAIFGQGLADHGKEAARISAQATLAAPPPPAPTTNVVNQVVEKSNQLTMVFLLVAVPMLVAHSGCGAARAGAGAGAGSFADCMAGDVKNAVGELIPAMSSALRTTIAGTGSVDRQQFRSIASPLKSTVNRCALKAAIDGMIEAVRQGDAQAAPPALDADALRAALDEQGWGLR